MADNRTIVAICESFQLKSCYVMFPTCFDHKNVFMSIQNLETCNVEDEVFVIRKRTMPLLAIVILRQIVRYIRE